MRNLYCSILSVVFLMHGCSSMPFMATEDVRHNLVLKKSSFDLDCNITSINVVKINDASYGAMGCNKKASYTLLNCQSDVLSGNWSSECQIILESINK